MTLVTSSINLSTRLMSHLARLLRDEAGGAATFAVLATPVVLGGLALTIDTGYIYLSQRRVQQQADMAAIAAAAASYKSASSHDELESVALRDAVRNGYVDIGDNTLTLNIPPTTGSHIGDATAVEVIIESVVPTFFARVFNLAATTVRGRAVAGYGGEGDAGGGGCVMALHKTAAQALRFQGSGAIMAPSCSVVSNSTSATAVYVGGSQTLNTLGIYTAGNVEIGSTAEVVLGDAGEQTGKPPLSDPYANLSVSVPAGCDHLGYSVSGSGDKTASPGTYCYGLQVGGSGTLYLGKGTYYIKGGDFKVTGTAKIRCLDCTNSEDGVTIVLTGDPFTGSIGTVSIAGTTDVQFRAPTGTEAGALRGVAIYQDRNATPDNAAYLTGTGNMRISGAIYMPAAVINYSGTSDLPAGYACVNIIGRMVEVQGNSRLTVADCPSMGVQAIAADGGKLLLLE